MSLVHCLLLQRLKTSDDLLTMMDKFSAIYRKHGCYYITQITKFKMPKIVVVKVVVVVVYKVAVQWPFKL